MPRSAGAGTEEEEEETGAAKGAGGGVVSRLRAFLLGETPRLASPSGGSSGRGGGGVGGGGGDCGVCSQEVQGELSDDDEDAWTRVLGL